MGNKEAAMKFTRVGGVLILSLVLVCGFQSLAAADLLKKATQLVNISSSSDTGILNGVWTRVMPDGTTAEFSIPPKKVLVMNSFTLRFTPSVTTTGPLHLLITAGDPPTLFFTRNLILNTDQSGNVLNASCDFTFNPGLACGVKPIFGIIKPTSGPNTGDVVPGDFGMRVLGVIP
jgi:hypothetical protein